MLVIEPAPAEDVPEGWCYTAHAESRWPSARFFSNPNNPVQAPFNQAVFGRACLFEGNASPLGKAKNLQLTWQIVKLARSTPRQLRLERGVSPNGGTPNA